MLGVMIVESGWGSMIPTAIIAHLAKDGAAAKSGQLNVGDQILAVNGLSFVGLPLTECQAAIKVGFTVSETDLYFLFRHLFSSAYNKFVIQKIGVIPFCKYS